MKKTILIWLVSVLALPVVAAAAPAATPKGLAAKEAAVSLASTTKPTSTPGTVQKAVKGAIAKCAVVSSKVQTKTANFDNSKIKHMAVYDNLKDRLTKIADRLTARGADVTALRADLAVLDTKIAKFGADYASYYEKMKSMQGAVCGQTAAQFKALLKETKTALQWVHRDAADIRAYFVSTIRVEIMKLRDSIKPATTTPATTTATTTLPKGTSTKAINGKKPIKPLVPVLPKLD